ncbi:NTP transferase domain-containing protein [Aminobacter carboxidus]|uniref:Molybdopterin-binding/glycosyltransferase family 2 protein n=1 Tax=Aminobacter carboxidus TaxID=376165 RepID=A0ABR9GV07_9HYPH|nr:molybdopterin-binding/glycosyltransferase family 2 protein [Aminobacter carboxidus]
MKFGPVCVIDAEGAILAHAIVAGAVRLRKAHRLTACDIAMLGEAGVEEVIAAVLDRDDLDEDAAASAIVMALETSGVEAKPAATGRVNLHASRDGVFTVDKTLIDTLNRIDPSITIATLADYTAVEKSRMVATVKIIPFAVSAPLIREARSQLRDREAFAVHAFQPKKVALVQTVLPGTKDSVLDKTARITQERLARSASRIVAEKRVPHNSHAVAEAIGNLSVHSDMLIVFGASAMCDFDDVIPAAIRFAGGEVHRAGMPVDPGNLIVTGRLGEKPVLGAPGCARSPKLNGFDWVLDRLIAGIDVDNDMIAGMGVGGLLMEIPARPQPREPAVPSRQRKVYAILLAAGRSSRMGAKNKLLADFDGVPLVRRMASLVCASKVSGVFGVVGHMSERVRQALEGVDMELVENPHHADGLASSIKAGFAALPDDADGVLIMLADMPSVSAADIDRLIASFHKHEGRTVVRATHGGKRGNPVLLPRVLFPEIRKLTGDIGARHVVESGLVDIVNIEIGAGAGIDVDTPEAMLRAGGVLVD